MSEERGAKPAIVIHLLTLMLDTIHCARVIVQILRILNFVRAGHWSRNYGSLDQLVG